MSELDSHLDGFVKRIYVTDNIVKEGNNGGDNESSFYQKIIFGTPGSGKSYKVKNDILGGVDEKYIFRTTFHPDSDYSSFVGCYKPKTNKRCIIKGNGISESQLLSIFQDSNSSKYYRKNKARYLYESLLHAQDIRDLGLDAQSVADKLIANGFTGCAYTSEATHMYDIYDWLIKDGYIVENEICYEFIPQAFTNAYVAAWQEPETQIYLIIEEINRGNCAQIFGDLFQLLDRKNGVSEYPINADADLRKYLEDVLGAGNEGIANGKLKLPANLNIIATMNTSDQSLFPMDSAFKRRWTWECVPIDYNHQESSKFIIKIGNKEYRWNDFLKEVNKRIFDTTDSEDKQMGNFFINADVDERQFIDKVMFYLWNDICKEEYHTSKNFFRRKTDDSADSNYEFSFNSLFEPDNSTEYLMQFMKYLGVNPVNGSVNAGQSVPSSSADNE